MRLKGMWMVTAGAVVAASAVALAASGNLDTSFGVGGMARENAPAVGNGGLWASAVQPDGRILVGGGANKDFRVHRYLANGTDDVTFGTGGIVSLYGGTTANPSCYDLALDGSGRIVAAGASAVPNGAGVLQRGVVVRLLSSGALDATFGTAGAVQIYDVLAAAAGTGARSATVNQLVGVALQSDGKIVVAGRVSLEEGKKNAPSYQKAILLARLLSNGTLDATFGTGGILVHDRTSKEDLTALDALAIQSDGRIVVGSGRGVISLTELPTGVGWVITRYTTSGAVDSTFPAILGANRMLMGGLTVDASDRILAAGWENYGVANVGDVAVTRYTPSGAVDSTFGIGGSTVFGANSRDNAISAPVVMPDGRIVLAVQAFPATGPTEVGYAARLTATGALDPNFGVGGLSDPIATGTANEPRSIAVAGNGDVLLAGRMFFTNPSPPNTADLFVARFLGN